MEGNTNVGANSYVEVLFEEVLGGSESGVGACSGILTLRARSKQMSTLSTTLLECLRRSGTLFSDATRRLCMVSHTKECHGRLGIVSRRVWILWRGELQDMSCETNQGQRCTSGAFDLFIRIKVGLLEVDCCFRPESDFQRYLVYTIHQRTGEVPVLQA